jgi:hypothetical protein
MCFETNKLMFDSIIETIKQWRRQHPEHAPKLFRIQKNIEKNRAKYGVLDYNYKRTHNEKYNTQAENIINETTDLFSKLKKLEFISVLSK